MGRLVIERTTALARAESAERENECLVRFRKEESDFSKLAQRELFESRELQFKAQRELTTLETRNRQLVQAASGMLENYLELKRISLAMACSDAPNWMGANLTPDDDVHVIAVRKVLGKP